MSDSAQNSLSIPQSHFQVLASASSYTWPNRTIGAGGWGGYSIDVSGATIIGVGLNVHGENRVTIIDNHPSADSKWWLRFHNWEDHEVTLDITAWFG